MSISRPPSALVTGGFGFLGQACARHFRAKGWRVVGLGHGQWTDAFASAAGFDRWVDADVSTAGLATLGERFDLIAHCASNGSVGNSFDAPLDAYHRTVTTTAELLEFVRRQMPDAAVVYPSSAAVYGAAEDRPLREDDVPNPVSPYGFHKKMVEDLLRAYSQAFGLRVAMVRFFSIYGPGLRKQLLWDAATKLLVGDDEVIFWGTGDETRDWIHVDDAAALLASAASAAGDGVVLNGASGHRVTVAEVISQLRDSLRSRSRVAFNGMVKPGDPRFYHADIRRALALGWTPSVSLDQGIQEYTDWMGSTR